MWNPACARIARHRNRVLQPGGSLDGTPGVSLGQTHAAKRVEDEHRADRPGRDAVEILRADRAVGEHQRRERVVVRDQKVRDEAEEIELAVDLEVGGIRP